MRAAGTPGTNRPDPLEGSGTRATGRSIILLVVLLGIVWGSAFPVIRAGIVAGAPPLVFAAVRYLLTAAALVPIAMVARTPRPTLRGLLPSLLFGGLLIIGAYGGLLYLGEDSTSGGVAAVLTGSAPLATALIGYRLLPAERFGRWGVLGLIVGFTGVTVLVLPQLGSGGSTGPFGPILIVGAVVSFALGSVLLRRESRISPSFWTLSVQFGVAGIVVGAVALLTGEPATLGNGAIVVPALAYLVVLSGIAGYGLYFHIHHTAGPTQANLVGYVNPATGVLVGLIVFGEAVTGIEIGGLFLIAGGLFLLQRDRLRAAPRLEEAPTVRPDISSGSARLPPESGNAVKSPGDIDDPPDRGSPSSVIER